MKKIKKSAKISARSTATARHGAAKRRLRRNRPLHHRLFLHPASLLLLLCVGVLLGGLTFRTAADTIVVTGKVLAPLPPTAATLDSPADQTHFTSRPITVTGTCPENTYVKLLRNGNLSGVAICGGGVTTYAIQTDLSLGTNVLVAQVYNVTDQPGPPSTSITVFYDTPPQPPPPVPNPPPVDLIVTSQDNTAFRKGDITLVSPYVTERGWAPPYSRVVVTFHSAPLTCATYADGNGNWSCTLDQALSPGQHTVFVVATTPDGTVLRFPSFYIYVSNAIASLGHINAASPSFLITSDFQYQPRLSGKAFSLSLGLSGGASPYAVTVQWGDGSSSTVARGDRSRFSLEHTYRLSQRGLQVYIVKVQAVDGEGLAAFLDIAQIVRGQGSLSGAPLVTDTTGSGSTPFSQLKQWVWFAWPVYGVTVLMVFSFWLGERQELLNLTRHKRPRRA
ncbi:MAG: hypothetical protein WA843_03120 [Candidatus Saccharimonadales bacterium]